jgi:nitrous oxidase accessory protein
MKAAALALVLLLTPGAASAREWTVGGAGADFPLIAPALAAAADGDVIRVGTGVYREALTVTTRVTIVGHGTPRLFGLGFGSVIRVLADGAEIRGLSIEGSGAGETNEMDAAIQVASSRTRIAGNTMRRVFYGVVVAGGVDNEIADNEIVGFLDLPFGKRGDGVYVYRAPRTRVLRNRVIGQRDGIYFQHSPDGRAVGNTVERCRYGLHVMFAHGIVVRGNAVGLASVGANIMDSRAIEIVANRFERHRGVSAVGLALKQCDDSAVRDNVLIDNARGVQVDGSTRNRFERNLFLYNDTAVVLFASAERNVFAGNRFEGNWSDAVVTGAGAGTRWSDAGRGNAWSGYAGFDFDGNGVGDTPHPLLTPFAAIEGANPAARLFLRTPAAAGLALAARAGFGAGRVELDPAPLIAAPRSVPAGSSVADAARGFAAAAVVLVVALALAREVSPC